MPNGQLTIKLPLQLTIEKLVYGGDGLARLPADENGRGKAMFVPFVLPGEEVEGTILESRPGFARGRLEKILQPSPQRVEAKCPYFQKCGGCNYQHDRRSSVPVACRTYWPHLHAVVWDHKSLMRQTILQSEPSVPHLAGPRLLDIAHRAFR